MDVVSVGLNLVGALVANVYLSVIDPVPTGTAALRTPERGSVVVAVLFLALTFAGGSLWMGKRDRRIGAWYERLRTEKTPGNAPDEVRRDLLNWPLRATLVTAAMWLLAAVASTLLSVSYRPLVGIALGGTFTSILVYLSVDLYRRPAIPVFFPTGDLSGVRAFRLSVLGRLLVVFTIVGVVPPALLVGLTWRRVQMLLSAPNPEAMLNNLLYLQAFILASGVAASVGLALLVTRSITGPLDHLRAGMARVQGHDLEARIPVTTNDELGYLVQRFNEMTAGLKEGAAVRAAHQRVEQELALAWQIQQTFLPRALPSVLGWQLAARLDPARQTSGDFYDIIPLPDGRLGLLVADVAGKGTGAALYMALSRTLIRTYAVEHVGAPELVLAAANRRIQVDVHTDLFVTVFYGVLDPHRGTMVYANAGHNPPYLFRTGQPQPLALRRTGIPLGIFPDASWERRAVALAPSDVLLAYSDGITEAQNGRAEMFGAERLLDAACGNLGRTAHDLAAALLQRVRAFQGEAPQADDVTLLVIRRDSD
jgi:serine phosphatase RsbU (regulator of sigma subunit)